jgi:nucleotide-binding universal stress UspA family protein
VFRNVLMGVDGSAGAMEALARAVELAQASHGRRGLLAAIATPSPWLSMPPFAHPVSRAQFAAELEAEAQRHVERAEQTVPADVPVTKLLARGRLADALLHEARHGAWGLIVVGHRVSARLLRRSLVPVLVVHASDAL